MTNERQIGQAMIEEVLTGRNGSALEATASAPAVRTAAPAVKQTVARSMRRMTLIEVVCEVPA
ncbi:hypothetical protein BJG93_04265 [Paraburkholderia sprentiae WSM5005]|uniref:Uncharacterized protein n=1 Tax=Paraburkholderia sprentiae WSM5005 TaxID=754502 RepID=A0A1I9YEF4_9BURK|nr:hypothetical protein [Paraburkholderia sprentiae]APA84687.1 hypothetical protein BJG93_04265 [Paraburkholderia sprentiae WSM5005]